MDTPEYRTLIENYPDYYTRCLQVGPSAIAVELRPSGILPNSVYHYLDNPHHDRNEKAWKLLSAIVAQVENDPVSLTTFTEAIESAELKLRFRNLKLPIVTAIVLTVALLLLYMPFEQPAYKNTLRFAKKVNSTYMNQAAIPSKTLLNSIVYEGVKLQLPFIIPKLSDVRSITDDQQVDEVINRIQPGSSILITGRPGVGKSALTNYMALKWAKGELLTHCILTLQVPLMSAITNVHALLDEVLPFYSDTHLVEQEIYSTEGRKVCLILDALDEYTPAEDEKRDLVYSVIRGKFLQQATILVTSRISAKTHKLEEAFDMRYNLTGFSRSDIDLYVAKLPTKLQQDILTVFNINYNVRRMCYLPLHMTMIVHLASDLDNEDRLKATDTETVLYTDFLLLTIEQYKERTGWSVKMAKDCLRDPNTTTELCYLLRKISWLAQVALLENTYTLNSTLLDQGQIKTLEQISLLGLDIKRGSHEFVHYYSFAHPTFQEYLAAFYISQLPENLALVALERHFDLGRFEKVWLFYLGIIGNYNTKLANEKSFVFSCIKKLYELQLSLDHHVFVKNKRCELGLHTLFIELTYEAKVTSLLQTLMYETSITGPECEYKLNFHIFDMHHCLYLAYVLNYVDVHNLELNFLHNFVGNSSTRCGCHMAFFKELKFYSNQITSVMNLTVTVGGMDVQELLVVVRSITELASNLRHLNLRGTSSWFYKSFLTASENRGCYLVSQYHVNTTWLGNPSKLKTLKTDGLLISMKEVNKLIPQLTNLRSLFVLLPIVDLDTTAVEFAQILSTVQTLFSLDIEFKMDNDIISEVSEHAFLELSKSIKQLQRLKSLSINCDLEYRSEEEANFHCANIISVSAGYLTDLRNLKLSRHVFRMSDALRLEATLSSLKQLTHFTLHGNMYEIGAERTIVSSVNGVKYLVVHGLQQGFFHNTGYDRFVYEAVYSLQSILWYRRTTVDTMSFGFEMAGGLDLTHLASALTKLNKLEYLEILSPSIERQEATDIYTAVTRHSSLQALHLAVNSSKKKYSTIFWKEIRRA